MPTRSLFVHLDRDNKQDKNNHRITVSHLPLLAQLNLSLRGCIVLTIMNILQPSTKMRRGTLKSIPQLHFRLQRWEKFSLHRKTPTRKCPGINHSSCHPPTHL